MATAGTDPVTESLTTSPALAEEDKPMISPERPLLERLNCAIRLWIFKSLVVAALGAIRRVQWSKYNAIAATYTKHYDVRPTLECRIFIPQSHTAGTKLPLYIDIHGGGFALCDPQTDDFFCHHMANKHGYCVVSINYRKAPSYPWPVPVDDCAALAQAVLADRDLPVDFDRVAMGGFSAGGNLVLAIAQLDGIKDKVKALVPIYPAVDFTSRHRGEFRKDKEGKDDILKHTTKLFNWGYVPVGTDRREKLLSPIYATRDDLPMPMYFVGAEYDILCAEASVMAQKLAGVEGQPDLGTDWEKNGIRWEMIPDVQHGFTHVETSGEKEEARLRLCADLYERVDHWLKRQLS